MCFIDGYTLHAFENSVNVNFYQKERLALQILENWQIIHEKQSDLQVYYVYFIYHYFKLKVLRGTKQSKML